ncbi:phosphomannomutase [Pseudosulfitobacter sp. DSM 107133]|uniref:phosphomannomutase n=1 Tax=Pseudosulfitobacter sp. DSM 107133 TaxID=2883100 RepID=UPI000DF37834|nr:phosphomannomutase [Pseudosulfitobacter sp. DSM 107133]UOA29032.1 Phosphoglucosamine mutase [Pseudosulfitobacter sp. DSM 107133]
MPPKFGTSGLRGLVTELTPELVSAYVHAFLRACPQGSAVHVGQDLRPSSPAIAASVIAAVRAAGLTAIDHGAVPTPALALASMQAGDAAVMVTGSHIPADRNGLKFYVPSGEVSKADETAILAVLETAFTPSATQGGHETHEKALPAYVARYSNAFGADALSGLRVGVYEHSSVARDVMGEIFRSLGAETVSLARSDVFIPVDTEAVDPATRDLLAGWARDHGLDAIVSTDGDSDRPMLADAKGVIVPGDLLGPITAAMLGADTLVTPVSSNTAIDAMPQFAAITRTRIGSPFVIAAMEQMLQTDPATQVAGYEANGGFLLGFDANGPAGPLPPLMTRDSILPLVAPLAAARAAGQSLSELVAALPPRFTAADRVQEVPSEQSSALIATLSDSANARADFFEGVDAEQAIDLTDGLRVTFKDGAVVHLRPSGNAPECRCYAEAGSADAALTLVNVHLAKLKARLG